MAAAAAGARRTDQRFPGTRPDKRFQTHSTSPRIQPTGADKRYQPKRMDHHYQATGTDQRYQPSGMDHRYQPSRTDQRYQPSGMDQRFQTNGTDERFQTTRTDPRFQTNGMDQQRGFRTNGTDQPPAETDRHVQPPGTDQRQSQPAGTGEPLSATNGAANERFPQPPGSEQRFQTTGNDGRHQYDYLKHYREMQEKERREKEREKERERRRLLKEKQREEKENDTDDEDLPAEELKKRLEKLSRNYDMDTMKVFLTVEALGESALRSIYSPERRTKWQSFLIRLEACRLDLTRHEKTRERYQEFLEEVGKEEQSRQWFMAVLKLLNRLGAEDTFDYITTHSYEHKHYLPRHFDNHLHFYHRMTYRKRLIDLVPHEIEHHYHRHDEHQPMKERVTKVTHHEDGPLVRAEETLVPDITAVDWSQRFGPGQRTTFCDHLAKLFERKLETWFDTFQAVAVRLTAHVKVSGLVRVLSGKVHALCTRKGRLHALVVKVTAQDTPRPLDVAELCLTKIMLIQNGLALPEELALDLLCLHLHPARPVLRLWGFTPSKEMETAIRKADIDEMIDAARLSQHHEMWADNITMEIVSTAENDPALERARERKTLSTSLADDSKTAKDAAPTARRERPRIPIPQYDFSPRRKKVQEGEGDTEKGAGAETEATTQQPASARKDSFHGPRTPMSISDW